MYVWGRMARMMLTAKSRGRYRMGEESRLSFRCLPIDIDTNIHLNNARYLMLADVGRIDIFIRSGLLGHARRRGWSPMMGGVQAVYVREIIRRALDYHATALILVHNHPSGDPQPSSQDIRLTRDIVEAGRHLKIAVHDHVIIGAKAHKSLRAMGLI